MYISFRLLNESVNNQAVNEKKKIRPLYKHNFNVQIVIKDGKNHLSFN